MLMPWHDQRLLGLDEIAVRGGHEVVSLLLIDNLRGLDISRHRLDTTWHCNLETTPVPLVCMNHGSLRPYHSLGPIDEHNLMWLRLSVSECWLEHLSR